MSQNTGSNQPLQVSQKEAAKILGYSERFLRGLKDVPCNRRGRTVRYPVEKLREWINQQATHATATPILSVAGLRQDEKP